MDPTAERVVEGNTIGENQCPAPAKAAHRNALSGWVESMAVVSRQRDDRDVVQQLVRCLCRSRFDLRLAMTVVAAEGSPIAGPREAVVTTTTGSGATKTGSSFGFGSVGGSVCESV